MSGYLVRQILWPLRLPMQVDPKTGELLHAHPFSSFTVFETTEAALQAIGQTVLVTGREDAQFEVLSVEAYHETLAAAREVLRKVQRATKAAKQEGEE